jgi:membrane-bound lytic murein transglycosylase B
MFFLLILVCEFLLAAPCADIAEHIDISTHINLRESAQIALEEYQVPFSYSSQQLHCLPLFQAKKAPSKKIKPSASYATEYRIQNSIEFYHQHKKTIDNLQLKVPSPIIISIMSIESNLGRFTGKHHTLTALANIVAETNPSLQHRLHSYMQKQLAALLYLSYSNQLDLESLHGSWDGGIGIPQFMPQVYILHAKSKSPIPNLFDHTDAMLSIDHYLTYSAKWQHGPIAKIITPSESTIKYIQSYLKENNEEDRGIELKRVPCNEHICPIIDSTPGQYIYISTNQEHTQHWLTYPNFEAIRRYNPRPEYAIAVTILANAIEESIYAD